jgi:hypothetical protein
MGKYKFVQLLSNVLVSNITFISEIILLSAHFTERRLRQWRSKSEKFVRDASKIFAKIP